MIYCLPSNLAFVLFAHEERCETKVLTERFEIADPALRAIQRSIRQITHSLQRLPARLF